MNKEACVIIPARYTSTRFPGKPLIDLCGKSMLRRVWEKCSDAIGVDHVYVATDDDRIANHCKENNFKFIMTGDCNTGTDRVAEAYRKLGEEYCTILNVQGDEPLIKPIDILKVAGGHKSGASDGYICCGMCPIYSSDDFYNPNIIKIVVDYRGYLIYASRSAIPGNKKLQFIDGTAFKQVCIYAFSPDALLFFENTMPGYIERYEEVEFLRFIESGKKIKMIEVSSDSVSVDIPEDADKVREVLIKRG
jgi:3-deoxy-manno-octulosonate cytidylyltransferase (CMP-KDO synthetase)